MAGLTTQMVQYKDGDLLLEAYVAYDKQKYGGAPLPVVIVCPGGMSNAKGDFECRKADALAHLGYVGFTADLYGKDKCGGTPQENFQMIMPFMANRKMLITRLGKVVEAVKTLPFVDKNKIAVIGFCFGGLCALDMARADYGLRGAVSFHGVLTDPGYPTPDTIKTKIIVLHGDADPHVPPEQVANFEKEMREKKGDWQLHIYGGVYHGFTHPTATILDHGVMYDEKADHRSWASMKHFLTECFH